jgi:hypoxanthine phosphoribosyltransferase
LSDFNELVQKYIKQVLLKEEEIQLRVSEIAERINEDYQGLEPVLVSVLKGSTYFLADLTRQLELPVMLDFMAIQSYGTLSETTGAVKLLKDLDQPIEDRDVLVIEDIIDTGLTINYLLRNLKARNPRSLRVCTLLDKSVRRLVPVEIAYRGFEIPDVFVVGYGLDFEQKFRNLPYIGVLDIDRVVEDFYG